MYNVRLSHVFNNASVDIFFICIKTVNKINKTIYSMKYGRMNNLNNKISKHGKSQGTDRSLAIMCRVWGSMHSMVIRL